MNVVDYVILGVLGVSVLFGLYRGFAASVLNVGGGLLSFIGSFWLYPKMAQLVQQNETLVQTLSHYTDVASRVGDLELSMTNVATLGQEGVQRVLDKVALPPPLDSILSVNLENMVYRASDMPQNVANYVSQTILQTSINIISFLVCFVALYIVISALMNLIRAVFRLPVLKQLDALAGGVFGLLRGLLVCLAAFTLVPLEQTVVPLDALNQLMQESVLAPIFTNGNLITAIMNGRIF